MEALEKIYRNGMQNNEVEQRTIFLGVVGSTAYGTSLKGGISDLDYSGVCVGNREHFLGVQKFEQADKWFDSEGKKIDKTVYNFPRAISLMVDNNPNMLDLLYPPDRCIIKCTPEWERIMSIRDAFISKKARHSYSGYAYSQIARIQTHRSYLMSPVKEPSRAMFGLPEKTSFPEHFNDIIAKLSVDWIPEQSRKDFFSEFNRVIDNEAITIFRKYLEIDLVPTVMSEFKKGSEEFLGMISSISKKFLRDEYQDVAKKELAYLSAKKNYLRYKEWEKTRNPKRKELEAKCGFDSKHASHAIRLSRMCVEILEGKGVLVDRTGIDADELLDIRLGNVPFLSILEEATRLEQKSKELYETSTLQYQPDRKLINETMMDIIEKYLWGRK